MRYLISLYGREDAEAAEPGSPEFEAEIAGYGRFEQNAADAVVDGAALQPTQTASTVRPNADAPLVTDGPFTEITEVMGGYYVLEADTLDDAIELARQIPAAEIDASGHNGGVEVRPLVQWWTRNEDGERPSQPNPVGQRYLAVIYGAESAADLPNTPAWEEGAAEHGRFIDKHGASLQAGAALHPAATATTVRVKDGDLVVTDGPFTEATEVVGGLYVLHTATRDEAVAVAADIPTNPGGAVELRPIMELDD